MFLDHKRPDGLTSSTARGNTPWNTPNYTPNKHVKQEGCETSGKYLRKWINIRIMFYFGAQYDFEIGPLRPIFNTPLKVAQIDIYTKTHEKPVENCWENDHIPEFLLILGPKVARKLDLWGPYSPHIYMYLQWASDVIQMWNQWKLFEKMAEGLNFNLMLWPKMVPKSAAEVHIPHTAESTCNEHVKVTVVGKSVKTFWENYQSQEFRLTLGCKMAQNLSLWGS